MVNLTWIGWSAVLYSTRFSERAVGCRALSQNAPHQFDAARGVPVVRPGRGDAGREALSAGGVLGTRPQGSTVPGKGCGGPVYT